MIEPLTRREREVLQLRADGLDLVEAAAQLGTSRDTVAVQSKSIIRKLKARNFAHAVAIAYHNGIFRPVGRRVIQINRAQALGVFNLSQQLPVNDEIEYLDQGNSGEVYVRAGARRFVLPRQGGYEALEAPAPMSVSHDPGNSGSST